jgi:hypothetical protein
MKHLIVILVSIAALSAQPYNGTAVGTPSHSAGSLTGSASNYYTLPAAANCPSFPCTMEMWFNASAVGWAEVMAGSNWAMGRGPGTAAYVRFGGVVVESGATSITSGAVHIVMASLDGSSVRLFVNGIHRGTTSGSAPVPTGAIALGQNWGGGTIDEIVIWTIDRYPGTTTFTPTASWPDNTSGLRAIYHLTSNGSDTAIGVSPLAATLSAVVGLEVLPTGGSPPYSHQLRSTAGACPGGSFSNDGAPQAGTLFARTGTSARCFEVTTTDSLFQSVTTNRVTAPTAPARTVAH